LKNVQHKNLFPRANGEFSSVQRNVRNAHGNVERGHRWCQLRITHYELRIKIAPYGMLLEIFLSVIENIAILHDL
ncbi:MAG: hypothetical protein J6B01_12850, partial [Ruminococcus sp.]|nr:hypothetical protein [Ruminococcus sp.]